MARNRKARIQEALANVPPVIDPKEKLARSRVLTSQSFDPETYDYDPSFRPYDPNNPMSVHTTAEMLECLAKHPNSVLDARVLHVTKEGFRSKKVGREKFLESFKTNSSAGIKFKESDSFASGSDLQPAVGQDFTPLLGGPFYKNLYYFQDYIRMHSEAFFAYHNDPFARAIVQITRDFTLGTGYDVQCDVKTDQGKLAMAAWKAFERANDLQNQIDQADTELSIYGETMIWKLPGNQSKITYQLGPKDPKAPKGMIPRVRLIDPSNIVEIITYPEDISRKLAYVWLTPTQYQTYTGAIKSDDSTPTQPTLKFIYRQIPADQMEHFKVNSVSNEKRGRSDLFPVFSYLKRLRDSVNYSLIALQKVSAYSLDTEIDGDQTDIDAYVSGQVALGTIPPAGSEFVHSKKVKRSYLGNDKAGGSSSSTFDWCLSCIAAGVGIPVSYFGTHLSGGSTRASALVSTEPVAKKMEKRREVIKRMIISMWDYCMSEAGIEGVDPDIIFPEIITQDRSAKLKDLKLAEDSRWLSPARVASMAAKELGVNDYDYNQELQDMEDQIPEVPMPLLNPGMYNGPTPEKDPTTTGLTSDDKTEIKKNDSTL